MDATTIQTIITSVGFPIFCVLALGGFIWHAYSVIMERSVNREDKLYGVLREVTGQMNKVTEINASFVEVLRTYNTDLESIRNDVTEIKEFFKGKEEGK